jgi:hypothetical protein
MSALGLLVLPVAVGNSTYRTKRGERSSLTAPFFSKLRERALPGMLSAGVLRSLQGPDLLRVVVLTVSDSHQVESVLVEIHQGSPRFHR